MIALTLACAGTSQPVRVAPNAFKASADSTAAAFARQLTLWGFTTTRQDSGGASIVKGSLRWGHGRELVGQSFGYWTDCGKELGLSRASTADEMLVEIVATVSPQDDPYQSEERVQSHARAEASFTAFERRALGDPAMGCSSRGLLEQALLNAGHSELKADRPYRGLQPDGPYAMSPRPGDSLSLPVADDPRLAYPASLEACAWDSLDQPYLNAKGEVTYAVTAEGTADTASLTVRSLSGVDTSTFRGAARKLVANCRFRARANGSPLGLVRQRLFFAAPHVLGDSYTSPGDRIVSATTPGDSAVASQIESATMLLCPIDSGLPPGRVELQLVVGLDGKVEPGTIRTVNATSPELARVAPRVVARCRFKPARWKGRPIRSLISLPLRVGPL